MSSSTPLKYPTVLSIAGFDGSGGAGIQADLKTFSALGCYGMTVLTALPIQNTQGVKKCYPIPEQCVYEQLMAIFEDILCSCIKIGMLHRPEIVLEVSKAIRSIPIPPIVLDPVIESTNRFHLVTDDTVAAIKQHLFPLTTLLTPNIPEASQILHREIVSKQAMELAALDLLSLGPQAVLLKGGHLEGNRGDVMEDCLCMGPRSPEIHWISMPKIETHNTHGTGCTLSAAIAAYLAKEWPLLAAIAEGRRYLNESLKAGAGYVLGHGHGPVHHFHAWWE